MKIDKRYPRHANALIKYGLYLKAFPSLKEFWKKADASKFINGSKRENRSGGERITFLCLDFIIYEKKIFIVSFKNSDSNGINWLCP